MTDRLYYEDSSLYNFDAEVRSVAETPRPAVILDRTAFYPTSGGQTHDTGLVSLGRCEVPRHRSRRHRRRPRCALSRSSAQRRAAWSPVRGEIDAARRRDHMQQHSAQHVLSAAFVRLFNMPTVSFHMADEYCSIDLDAPSLSKEQVESAEQSGQRNRS